MSTFTKKQLIQTISAQHGRDPSEVKKIVQAFLEAVTNCLSEGNRLEFRDFGVFETVQRKEKVGRNPKQASVPILIPERTVVKFTPGKRMKDVVAGTSDLKANAKKRKERSKRS